MAAPTQELEVDVRSEDDVEVKLAGNEYGPAIGVLAVANHWDEDVDWSEVYPYWLVALVAGKVVGAIQFCPSKPIGRLELLMMWPDLPPRIQSFAVRKLVRLGLATLQGLGLQGVIGTCPSELAGYKEVLEDLHDLTEINEGWLMYGRLNGRSQEQE